MEEPVRIGVDGGVTLEGRVGRVARPRGGLVICHPHPLYGGDMDNPVVVRAAEVAREAGLATLRFNFRGVGASSGVHDKGQAEQDDVLGALGALRAQVPGTPLGLAGYSFGASVASRVAPRTADLAALCLIAPPLAMLDVGLPVPGHLRLLVVAGTRDPYCPLPDLERLAARLPEGTVERIEDADHFFSGTLFPMGEAVRRWAAGWARP